MANKNNAPVATLNDRAREAQELKDRMPENMRAAVEAMERAARLKRTVFERPQRHYERIP